MLYTRKVLIRSGVKVTKAPFHNTIWVVVRDVFEGAADAHIRNTKGVMEWVRVSDLKILPS